MGASDGVVLALFYGLIAGIGAAGVWAFIAGMRG